MRTSFDRLFWMNQQQTLIKILADRQWHSGEQLAAHFELSRTAIWKRIAQLRAEGLTIESDRGTGYRLLDRVDWFDANTLASYLSGAAVQRIAQIDAQLSLGSTNKACLDLLARREGT
ncbi:HTH domain-containing protein, partial [bacterium]|nr:HTH domain-containing protein [bacterium]